MTPDLPAFSKKKIPVLIVHHRHEHYKQQLESFSDHFEITSIDHRDQIPFDSHPAEILLCWKFQDHLLERLLDLRWIAAMSAGVDHILEHRNLLKNVLVTRAKGTMGKFLAEYSLQHTLNHLHNYQTILEQRHTQTWRFVKSNLLSRITVTIYGMGSLGTEVGKLFKNLGASVQGIKRSISSSDKNSYNWVDSLYSFDSWQDAIADTDVHILLLPHTSETDAMFNANAFSQMRSDSLLINIGRGSLLVENDLINALDSGKPGNVVLDVFNEEPLHREHPFWRHPKILVTPHCAGPSEEESLLHEFIGQFNMIRNNIAPERIVSFDKGY